MTVPRIAGIHLLRSRAGGIDVIGGDRRLQNLRNQQLNDTVIDIRRRNAGETGVIEIAQNGVRTARKFGRSRRHLSERSVSTAQKDVDRRAVDLRAQEKIGVAVSVKVAHAEDERIDVQRSWAAQRGSKGSVAVAWEYFYGIVSVIVNGHGQVQLAITVEIGRG